MAAFLWPENVARLNSGLPGQDRGGGFDGGIKSALIKSLSLE
jgi:hypothetical protein